MATEVEQRPESSIRGEKPRVKIEHAGPYRLLETVGKGGMATVKVGLDPATGRKVAVKIVEKEKLSNPREQASMAREITIMRLLRHPNVLRLYDIYESPDKIMMVLDYYKGGDLYHLIIQNGPLRPSLARRLFAQLISGIQFCHDHMVIHRDLKPENLLLSADHQTLVLSDFGLSTAMLGNRQFLKTRCGTVHYIAPEVAKGEDYIGMASDVWSCGVILFTMATASLPFDGENAIDVLKKIARGDFSIPAYLQPELQDLLKSMLCLNPSERISTRRILDHPWLTQPTPILLPEAQPPSPHSSNHVNDPITSELIEKHQGIIDNLILLGWQREELIETLLSEEKDIAKVFFNLLLARQNRRVKEEPRAVTSKDILNPASSAPSKLLSPISVARQRRSSSIGSPDAAPPPSLASPTSRPSKAAPDTILTKSSNPKLSRQIRRVAAGSDEVASSPTRQRSSTEHPSPASDPSRRRATVGDGPAPLAGFWSTGPGTPGKSSSSRIKMLESGKSIQQIFDNLKLVFMDLDADVKVKKRRGSMKVTASHKDADGKKSKIKVSLQESKEGGSVVTFKNASGKKEDNFESILEVVEKKLDETVTEEEDKDVEEVEEKEAD